LEKRLQYADHVLFLDFSPWLCAFRALKRWIKQNNDQADGCPQKMDVSLLKFILYDYRKENRAQIKKLESQYHTDISWVTLTSPKTLEHYVERIKQHN
jgi:adenylate kinase family enzyme